MGRIPWGKVILDVECLPDLLRCLSLDHVGHSLECDVKEPLDIEVVGCQDQLKESSLVHLKKENTHKHATHLDLDSVQPSESQHPRWRCHPSSSLCSRHPQVEVGRPATNLKSS